MSDVNVHVNRPTVIITENGSITLVTVTTGGEAAGGGGVVTTDNVLYYGRIGSPDHVDTLDEVLNHMWSSGVLHSCELVDNLDGSITIGAGYAAIRPAADSHAQIYMAEITDEQVVELTDNATNYVYLDYAAGALLFVASTSPSAFNCLDKCVAYIVHRSGTTLRWIDVREQNVDLSTKVRRLFLDFSRFIHKAGGTVLGEPSGLALSVSAGSFYCMIEEIEHIAFDTSIPGTDNANVFTLAYRDGIGGHTIVAEQKLVSSTLYDDGDGTPGTLGNNKYGVAWVYVINDTPSDLWVVMGQQEYASQADADIAAPPSDVPSIITGLGVLIGYVTFQKSASSFSNVYSAFSAQFSPSQAAIHEGLPDLLGGAVGEHYHTTAAEHAIITGNGILPTPANYTPSSSDIHGHLDGIDDALASAGGGAKYDLDFDSTDQDGSYDVTVTHGLNVAYPAVTIFGPGVVAASMPWSVSDANTVILSPGATLPAGTFHVTVRE